MRKRTVIVALLVLALFGTSLLEAQRLSRGFEYDIVLPSNVLVREGNDWTSTHDIYGMEVADAALAPSGTLPTVLRGMQLEKVDGREIEFRTPGTWVKLRFRDAADVEERLDQFAAPAGTEADELVAAALGAAASWAFSETSVPQGLWRALALYAYTLDGELLNRPARFRGGEYLDVSIGVWTSVFNTSRINQAQRTAIVVGELLDRVKGVGALTEAGLAGLLLRVRVPFRDFVGRSGSGADTLNWYIPSAVIPQLIDFEITSQDFVDQSVVVIDGTRVEVDLSNQG